MPQFKNKPRLVYWEVTESCNHYCIHCFNYWRHSKNSEIAISIPTSSKILMTIAHKIAEINPSRVVITGGEPLLVFSAIRPAIDFLLSKEIQISINTNCALLTDEIAKYLSQKKIGLFVSFPSYISTEFNQCVGRKDAFEQVTNGLEIAKRNGVKLTTNTVVSKINLASLYKTVKYLKENYNLKFFCATYASKPINATAEFETIMLNEEERHGYLHECVRAEKELDVKIRAASHMAFCSFGDYHTFQQFAFKGACSAGKTSLVITAVGDVRACVRDTKSYGNILEDSFDKIWMQMSEWRNQASIPVQCKFCPVRRYCKGGCRVDNMISPKTGQQIDKNSVPERKWRTYIWTQRLLFRKWISWQRFI